MCARYIMVDGCCQTLLSRLFIASFYCHGNCKTLNFQTTVYTKLTLYFLCKFKPIKSRGIQDNYFCQKGKPFSG